MALFNFPLQSYNNSRNYKHIIPQKFQHEPRLFDYQATNHDIRAKLKRSTTELQQWEQLMINELRRALCEDVEPP